MSAPVWVAVWPIDTPGAPELRHLIRFEGEAWCLHNATAACTLELPNRASWFIGKLAASVSQGECPECREILDTMKGVTP